MASRAEHRAGLTPILKRLAFYYLGKGVGTHRIENHPSYDEAVVRQLYDFAVPEALEDDLPPQGAFVVEFRSGGRRIRWVEFGVRCIGGGGEPIMRET